MYLEISRIFHGVKCDLKKILCTKYFYISVILTGVVFMLTPLYTTDTGKSYNAISALLSYKEVVLMNPDRFSFNTIISNYANSNVTVYGAALTMIPLINVLVNEKRKGALRLQLFRMSKGAYTLSKLLVSLVTGGLTLVCGYMVFCGYAYVFFHKIEEPVNEMLFKQKVDYKSFMCIFLFGAISTVLGYILSEITENIYLVYCIPFIINYLLLMLFTSIIRNYVSYGSALFDVYVAVNPVNILNLKYMENKHIAYILVANVMYMAFAYIIYRFIISKKVDCGD